MKEGKVFEEIEKKEKEPRGRVLKFFELTKKEEKELKDRISEHNGTVRIFVHPNYEEYAKWAEESERPDVSGETKEERIKTAAKLRKMDDALERMFKLPPDKVPPIVIFYAIEGVSNWAFTFRSTYNDELELLEKKGDYTEKLAEKYKIHNDVFIIPTREFSPDPLLAYAQNAEEAWEETADLLKSLSIKKVVIGGAELYTPGKSYIEEQRKKGEEFNIMKNLSGCLGSTIDYLQDNFEIELSTLTFPEGRKEIRKNQKT